ncbi:hypothetical protein [Rhizobium sp. L1K21]|uniref:hypothetical protein n=1 Tax=Rhizobium sp. L1K21 TaxID=2954933 RepID=UPI002093B508|nr:hypothetical protein [Rhizobium sp. L1K21]MCO6184840.1 hypothetical protein [Rhizobium sp. L1K21]
MMKTDLNHWPLVVNVAKGAMTSEENAAFLADWAAWLDRGDPFVTLRVFTDSESLRRPDGGGREAKAWLQSNSARIKTLVKGMATVVPADQLDKVSRMDAEKLFGVPAKCFDTVEGAIAWISSVMPEEFSVAKWDMIHADVLSLMKGN